MYNHSSIRTGLYGLLGFKTGLRSEFDIIDTANKATSSGMYYQDYHSLITVEVLKAISPSELSDADFNTWLTDLVKASFVKTINTLMQKFRPESKALYENLRLFNYANVIDTKLTYTGNAFVGYEIELCHSDNIMLVLNAIGLTFDAADTFNLYVFHSSKQDPIYTIEVTPEQDIEAWESQTAKYLEHITDTYVGGKFYIGYLQQDVTANAINREWDMANVEAMKHLFTIQSMKVADHTTATLFDLDSIDYTSETYGLNFAFTVQTNITKQLLTQKSALVNVIGYGVAVDILERVVNSIRANDIKKETRDLAFNELNIESGLKAKYERELKIVHLDFAGLDKLTMKKRSRISNLTAR